MSAEPAREFLDTNILVYAHDTSAGAKRIRATELVDRLARDHLLALSVQVLQEFYVTVTAKLRSPVTGTDAAAIVSDLSAMPTHAPTGADVLAAIDLHQRLQLSFWDAMVIRSAWRLGCSTLWTEDLSPGTTYVGVKVRNPFQAA